MDIFEEFENNPYLYFIDRGDEVFPVSMLPTASIEDIGVETDTMFTDGKDILTVTIQFDKVAQVVPVADVNIAIVGRDEWEVGVVTSTKTERGEGILLVGTLDEDDAEWVWKALMNESQVAVSLKDELGVEFAKRLNEAGDPYTVESQYDQIDEPVELHDLKSRLGMFRQGEQIDRAPDIEDDE